jgi:hypothetical protein
MEETMANKYNVIKDVFFSSANGPLTESVIVHKEVSLEFANAAKVSLAEAFATVGGERGTLEHFGGYSWAINPVTREYAVFSRSGQIMHQH